MAKMLELSQILKQFKKKILRWAMKNMLETNGKK